MNIVVSLHELYITLGAKTKKQVKKHVYQKVMTHDK